MTNKSRWCQNSVNEIYRILTNAELFFGYKPLSLRVYICVSVCFMRLHLVWMYMQYFRERIMCATVDKCFVWLNAFLNINHADQFYYSSGNKILQALVLLRPSAFFCLLFTLPLKLQANKRLGIKSLSWPLTRKQNVSTWFSINK